MGAIEQYYNKFNEDGRLTRRHGIVEFETTMHFVREFLSELKAASEITILDVGAATGAYSVPLADEGYDVTAVELVTHNLNILKKKGSSVKAYQGDAVDLSRFPDESFDVVLEFGPMYHLVDDNDKITALREAKRVLKPGGRIFTAYCMNEYSVLTFGFKQGNLLKAKEGGKVSGDYHFISGSDELYSYVRLEDIDRFNEAAGLIRDFIFSADGAANYMREELKAMPDGLFEEFLSYHLATCRRPELMGAGFHTVDVLKKR